MVIRVRKMKLRDLLAKTSFKAIGLKLDLDVQMVDGRLQVRGLLPHPLWSLRLSAKSSFCRAVIQTGMLTHRQMVHAARQVMRSFFWPRHNPIRVSPLLELHATEEQKRRKIDLVDYIFESESAPFQGEIRLHSK